MKKMLLLIISVVFCTAGAILVDIIPTMSTTGIVAIVLGMAGCIWYVVNQAIERW
jgi:hypothetical protein